MDAASSNQVQGCPFSRSGRVQTRRSFVHQNIAKGAQTSERGWETLSSCEGSGAQSSPVLPETDGLLVVGGGRGFQLPSCTSWRTAFSFQAIVCFGQSSFHNKIASHHLPSKGYFGLSTCNTYK